MFPEASARIHGITTDIMREKGNPIKKVLKEFQKDFTQCQYIVAHNLNFDKTILRVELFRNGFPNLFQTTKIYRILYHEIWNPTMQSYTNVAG